jgi:acetyl esterase
MAEPFVRPDVRQFLDATSAAPGPKMPAVGPVEARAMMRGMGELFDMPTGELALIRDIEMSAPHGGKIALRLFDARSSRSPGPVVLFLHGGGFVLGDIDCYQSICAEIARGLDLPVIAVDYRLAPEHPWPAAPEDCEAAARWVASHPEALGREVTGLIVAGDSAGGGLAIVTTMALRDAPAAVPVLAQWPIYPVTDLAGSYASHADFASTFLLEMDDLRWFYAIYAADRRHWRASPILGDQTGMPPTLVITSGLDPLRDEGRAYAAAAIKAGVPTVFREAQGMIHGFLNFRRAIPSAIGDLQGGIAALRTLLTSSKGVQA